MEGERPRGKMAESGKIPETQKLAKLHFSPLANQLTVYAMTNSQLHKETLHKVSSNNVCQLYI